MPKKKKGGCITKKETVTNTTVVLNHPGIDRNDKQQAEKKKNTI